MKSYELKVSSSCCTDFYDTPGSFKFEFPRPLKTTVSWSVTESEIRFHRMILEQVSEVQVDLVDSNGNPVEIKRANTTVKLLFRQHCN
jgi:hypothetical protein